MSRRKAPHMPVCQQLSSLPSGAATPAALTIPPTHGPGVSSKVRIPSRAA